MNRAFVTANPILVIIGGLYYLDLRQQQLLCLNDSSVNTVVLLNYQVLHILLKKEILKNEPRIYNIKL